MTLEQRGLDFADAAGVFAGVTVTLEDERFDYGEVRFRTFGRLGDVFVLVVWTERAGGRHIISMRKCHAREASRYRNRMG